jgi:hypothetical protein
MADNIGILIITSSAVIVGALDYIFDLISITVGTLAAYLTLALITRRAYVTHTNCT